MGSDPTRDASVAIQVQPGRPGKNGTTPHAHTHTHTHTREPPHCAVPPVFFYGSFNKTFYATVRATNWAGLATVACSDGVTAGEAQVLLSVVGHMGLPLHCGDAVLAVHVCWNGWA